jgi:hypothetical protein
MDLNGYTINKIMETREKIIGELLEYFKTIESFDKDSGQDGTVLHAYLIHLTQIMSRSNFLMAEYQRKFRQEKKAAYEKLTDTVISKQRYYAPSLAKEYIDSQCYETGYVYDLAERVSRLCSHTIDAVRTIVSSLKQEKIFSQYQM